MKTLSKRRKNYLKNGKRTGKSEVIAFYPGRFQPFHKGHLNAIKYILKKYRKVIIGIGSSQESRTKRNPFTYSERKRMIESTLKYYGIDKRRYSIVPVPDFFDDEKWSEYCIERFHFDVVVTGSLWTLRCFKNKKPVERVKFFKRNIYRATLIRRMILNNDKRWKNLVPKPVAEYLQKINVHSILLSSSNRKRRFR